MAQSLASIWLHIVFSTKNRFPFLKDERLRQQLHSYLAAACAALDSPAAAVGGVQDHVHILCLLSKNLAVKELIKRVKQSSSGWMKTQAGGIIKKFYWQAGYGAFSVSHSNVPEVRQYIERQVEHHKRMTFKQEFVILLKRHNVTFDSAHIWD